MTLTELIPSLDELPQDFAIYATPRWSPASVVVAIREPLDGSAPAEAQGKTYLTSVRKARQVIAARRAIRPDRQAAEELAAAIVYFAIYDESEPLPSLQSGEINVGHLRRAI